MDSRISIITLGVKDLNKSTAFYKTGLGLPLQKPANEGISFFLTRSTWLALYPVQKLAEDIGISIMALGSPTFTLAHNVGSKAQVNQLLNQAEHAGATIVDPAHDRFWGGYSGYFSDLDGYYWEIAWNPHFKIE